MLVPRFGSAPQEADDKCDDLAKEGLPAKRATQELATFAAQLRYEDLPSEVVHQAERLALDTCCCAIGGYILDNGKIFLRVLESLGGKPEATLFPTGHRTSVAAAAYVNTELANLLDLDDNLLYHSHFANTSVMPALAMAERQGASGKALVTAIVAAFEVTARITLSLPGVVEVISPPPDLKMGWPNPWGHSFNTFGAAVGAGKLLLLSPETMVHALGIAGYTAPVPGCDAAFSSARLTGFKYAPYGGMAWSGVVAARLAQEGLTADSQVLESDHGFWKMIGAKYCDFDMLTRDLGSKWWILDTSIKPYPAGTWMRNSMLAVDQLMSAHDFRPAEIEQILVKTWVLREKSPATQTEPQSYLDTQVSYPYLLAMRVLRIPPNRWHAKEVYTDPLVLDTMKKIRIEGDPTISQQVYDEVSQGVRRATKAPARVEIAARGQTFSEYVEYAKGDPFSTETRLSDDELAEKFRTHTTDLLRSSHIEQAIEALLDLSSVHDVRTVTPLLTA
ncbi:MAG: MmgE/PrpD family protein [Chloroflexi bacterium]|nr:MmgE/PrpD family protein [Chloroflexota bacterium]